MSNVLDKINDTELEGNVIHYCTITVRCNSCHTVQAPSEEWRPRGWYPVGKVIKWYCSACGGGKECTVVEEAGPVEFVDLTMKCNICSKTWLSQFYNKNGREKPVVGSCRPVRFREYGIGPSCSCSSNNFHTIVKIVPSDKGHIF